MPLSLFSNLHFSTLSPSPTLRCSSHASTPLPSTQAPATTFDPPPPSPTNHAADPCTTTCGHEIHLMSSDRFKSVEHRVLAKKVGSRISVACFFSTRHCPSSRLYGPIKELISDDNPPIYKDVLVSDYTTYYLSKELDGRSAMDNFKL